jgi:glycosyltransferase involved in cell wall biosynthesis
MKIYAYPADATGCGHFRIIWPAEELKKQGYDVTVMPPESRGQFHAEITNGVVKRVSLPSDADVIVLQRVSHKFLAQAIEVMRRQGVAVVMDIDDDLSSIHPNNPAWKILHPKTAGNTLTQDHSWHHVETAARNSTLTVVSSDALALKYRGVHGARVIPNFVPNHYLEIEHEDNDTIGWCGSAWTHPDDGPEVGPAVARLVNNGATFRFAGPREHVATAFGVGEDDVEATGSLHIDDWPHAVTRIGVGIAPLANTRFNAAKSYLKPLEYAALGVPCVMSPRAEYVKLHEETGIGVLAERPKEWYRELKRLVEDESYRRLRGLQARVAAQKLSYAQHASRWMEVWEEAARLR